MVKRESADEHYKRHKQPGKCVLCTWQRNIKRWTPKLPAILPEWEVAVRGKDDGKVQVGESWVRVRCGPKGHYRDVCVCCKQFRSSSKGLDLQDLRKHHVSTKHRRAMMDMLGLDDPHDFPTARFQSGWLIGDYDNTVGSASLESNTCPRQIVCATSPDRPENSNFTR